MDGGIKYNQIWGEEGGVGLGWMILWIIVIFGARTVQPAGGNRRHLYQ